LGWALRRPGALKAPAGAIELVAGEMGRQVILASQRVMPARLAAAGFPYTYPDLEDALRFELGKSRRRT
jgi:NAD dependent epimerase/dehydratase family enzyme